MGSERKVSPWLAGAVCLVVGLGVGGIGMFAARRGGGLPAEELERLTVEAERSPLTLKIRVNGSVETVRNVNLMPKNAGRLERLLVNQGDVVTAGDLIAVMESRDLEAPFIQAKARQIQAEARLKELQAGGTDVAVAQGAEEVRQARAQMVVEAAQVKEAEAQIAEALAQVDESQAQLDLAEQQLKRNLALESEGAISRDRLDELTTAANRAQANLKRSRASQVRAEAGFLRTQASQAQAQSRLEASQLRLQDTSGSQRPEVIEQAEAQVFEALGQVQAVEVQKEDTLLRAPFDAVVTQLDAEPGDFVTPTTFASGTASTTPTSVVTLAQGLEVLANVPEVDINAVKPGQIVEVTADAFPEQTFIGQVNQISLEAVEEQSVTSFEVRVALNSGQDQLRSGMNVDLTFIGESIGNALVVPTVAIVTREGERGVLVPDSKNEPEFQLVTTGVSIGDETQILSGIDAGERVFIDLPSDRRFQEEE